MVHRLLEPRVECCKKESTKAVMRMKRIGPRTDPGVTQPSHPAEKGQNKSQEPKTIKRNKVRSLV